MNARLSQVLKYLERDGVTEVVLRVGQPVSMQTAKGPTDVTARALSNEQLEAMIRDTDLAPVMAARGQDTAIELQVGALRVVARVTRGDDGIAVTLTRAAPPIEPPEEFEVDLEFEPPEETKRALAAEPPMQRSVTNPRPPHFVPHPSPVASLRRDPPPLELGIDLDHSLDEMPDSVDHGAQVPAARAPVQPDSNSGIQRIDPHAGHDRRDRQDLRASFGAFQRVDLRDAGAPTPKPDRAESTLDASAWADIDLAPPSGTR